MQSLQRRLRRLEQAIAASGGTVVLVREPGESRDALDDRAAMALQEGAALAVTVWLIGDDVEWDG